MPLRFICSEAKDEILNATSNDSLQLEKKTATCGNCSKRSFRGEERKGTPQICPMAGQIFAQNLSCQMLGAHFPCESFWLLPAIFSGRRSLLTNSVEEVSFALGSLSRLAHQFPVDTSQLAVLDAGHALFHS